MLGLTHEKLENRNFGLSNSECAIALRVWGMKKIGKHLVKLVRTTLLIHCVELVVEPFQVQSVETPVEDSSTHQPGQ